MAMFAYKALNKQGKYERGTLHANSEKEARAMLQAKQIFPLDIHPSQPFSLAALLSFGKGPKASLGTMAQFTRQFGTLLDATIPYDTSLEMIINQTNDLPFKGVLSEVRSKVMEGAYLADAFSAYPRVFPKLVVNMVRSGEASNTLAMIMHRQADYYENMGRLRSKLTSVLVYPAFMTVFGFAIVSFMVTFIVPKITSMFDKFGVTLPLPTRILIGTSDLFIGYWWLLLILAGLFGWGVHRFLSTEKGKLYRDQLELKIPIWKNLKKKLILQRFTQTFGTLLSSGVELKDALEVSTEVMENRVYLEGMERAIFDVQNQGASLSVALRKVELFPEDILQMISIGEETAMLDKMLENVSTRLTSETTSMMDGATALFEPIMILGMGGVIGFIVISIMLPMLQMNQLVR